MEEEMQAPEVMAAKDLSFRDIINAAPIGIIVFDNDTRVIYANRLAEQLFDQLMGAGNSLPCGDFIRCEKRHAAAQGCGHADNCPVCPLRSAIQAGLEGQKDAVGMQGEILLTREPGQPVPRVKFKTSGMVAGGRQVVVMTVEDITTRKQAEEMFKAKEAHFESIVSTSQEWLWSMDAAGHHTFSNATVESILGYRPEEIVGHEWHRNIHEDDFLTAREMLSQCREKKTGWKNFVLRWRHRDGSCRYLESNAVPVQDATGVLIGFHGSDRDITERKRAQEAMRESEGRFRLMFMNAPMPYQSLDSQGNFIAVNQAFLDTLGYSREELIGRNFGDILHPDWKDHFKQNFPRFKAIGEILGVEFELVKKDGSTILVFFNGKIQHDMQGQFKQTHCIFQDITERKRIENALRDSERLLRVAGRLAHIGGWSVDLATNRVKWSDEVAAIHGVPPGFSPSVEEAVGFFAPEYREKIAQVLNACIRDGTPYDEVMQIRTTAGKRVWIRTMGMAERDEAGTIVAVKGAFQDITGRVRAQEEQEKLQSQLRHAQKMESVGRLAGGVAHDFNNMLGVILGHTEMALEQLDPDQPLFDDLQEIGKAARRSADLTRQLLGFARKQIVSPKVLDLNETVAGMLKMLRRLIGEEIYLDWHPGRDVWPVKVDPSQIDQILANLCLNARDAIAGVGTITITTENAALDGMRLDDPDALVTGDYVRMTIKDDGCGMVPETFEHLFEPFFTTKPLGQGTGLGLATVYGIVKQNEGYLQVMSTPGRGTTFTLFFPRHLIQESLPHTSDAALAAAHGHETILLVEDEPSILRMTTLMLERQGYTVLPAASPGDALRLAQGCEGEIDLLMTDVIMPGMNGRDLAGNILAIFPALKCLFMSGYTADVIAKHGVLEEGVHFIQKPYSMNDLCAKVRSILEEH